MNQTPHPQLLACSGKKILRIFFFFFSRERVCEQEEKQAPR